jgi:glycosyltransferase involved in cell wall biosynthesis
MSKVGSLALVISTYDQPEYLRRVLTAVTRQSTMPGEVVVADDGSGELTREIFRSWAAEQRFRCEHVWQPHEGFRKSRILNRALAWSQSAYVVFLDGDTVPHPRFIEDHSKLAKEGQFIQGHRALIEQKAAAFFGKGNFVSDRRRALVGMQLHGLKHAYRWPVPLKRVRNDLRGVRGCNCAIWKADLARVNGYNEAFKGWGREDSELVVRLMNSGIKRVDVRGWVLSYHLWHPPASRSGLPANDQLLDQARSSGATECGIGLREHLPA